jgi:hypothetical protein
MARQQARSAQISTLFSTGTSLLSMGGGFGGGTPKPQYIRSELGSM